MSAGSGLPAKFEQVAVRVNHVKLVHSHRRISRGLYQCKTTSMGSAERVVAKIKGHEYVVTTGASFGVEFLWRCVPETERPERPYKGPYTLTEAEG